MELDSTVKKTIVDSIKKVIAGDASGADVATDLKLAIANNTKAPVQEYFDFYLRARNSMLKQDSTRLKILDIETALYGICPEWPESARSQLLSLPHVW